MTHPAAAVLDRFATLRALAILRASDAGQGREAMAAAIRGGFRLVEVTLTTPDALALIGDLAATPDLVVGAGTVLTPDEARAAVAAGASFLVSPVLDAEVVATAATLGVPVLPGCATPTELFQAHRLGAPLQKLFPAPGTGPEFLRSVLAPLPMLRVVPTNGVTLANAAEWLAAGAVAVGFARELFPQADLVGGDWAGIEARATRLLAAVAATPRR